MPVLVKEMVLIFGIAPQKYENMSKNYLYVINTVNVVKYSEVEISAGRIAGTSPGGVSPKENLSSAACSVPRAAWLSTICRGTEFLVM